MKYIKFPVKYDIDKMLAEKRGEVCSVMDSDEERKIEFVEGVFFPRLAELLNYVCSLTDETMDKFKHTFDNHAYQFSKTTNYNTCKFTSNPLRVGRFHTMGITFSARYANYSNAVKEIGGSVSYSNKAGVVIKSRSIAIFDNRNHDSVIESFVKSMVTNVAEILEEESHEWLNL
jgi:hypothetical protein